MPRSQRERYVPTPDEIREECARIREGWSKERWAKQSGPKPWHPPVIDMSNKKEVIMRTLLLLAVLALPAEAASPSVRVITPTTGSGGCGGTLVVSKGSTGWGVTASHCNDHSQSLTIRFDDGTTAEAKWVAFNDEMDLALFEVPVSASNRAATLAGSQPAGSLHFDGSRGVLQVKRVGDSRINCKETGRKLDRVEYYVRGKVRPGASGGGVWSGDLLVGVASHIDDGDKLYACTTGQLATFLQSSEAKRQAGPVSDKEMARRIKRLEESQPVPGPPGPEGPPGLDAPEPEVEEEEAGFPWNLVIAIVFGFIAGIATTWKKEG